MRELKFRAWTIDCNRFKYFEIGENDDCYGMFRVAVNKFGSVVEQYTGLKDKNGKEIYEGDIANDGNHICIIRWSEHFTEFEAVNEGEGYASDIWYVAKYGEVIGNIHENPELLKEKE